MATEYQIVTDGTPQGTRLSIDGQPVGRVQSIAFTADAEQGVQLVIRYFDADFQEHAWVVFPAEGETASCK